MLSMHREARAQIISQLREIADGRTEKSFGNGLRLEWEGKLGLVAGVTPIIDEQHAFLAVMGERFVLYRMPEVSRPEIARRSLARRGREDELRTRISSLIAEFLAQFRNVGYLELPDRFTEPLIALADIVTRARSGVARDYQTRDILYLPEPEAPTRFAKQIAQLMAAAISDRRPGAGLAACAEGRLGLGSGCSLGGDSPPRTAGGCRVDVCRAGGADGAALDHGAASRRRPCRARARQPPEGERFLERSVADHREPTRSRLLGQRGRVVTTVPARWTKHRPIALGLAREYRVPGMDPDDVRQEALVALWEACRAYDREKGTFPPFARLVINRRLTDLLRAATREKRSAVTVSDVDVPAHDELDGQLRLFSVLEVMETLSVHGAGRGAGPPERCSRHRLQVARLGA